MSHVSHEDAPVKIGGRAPYKYKLTLAQRIDDLISRELGVENFTPDTKLRDFGADSLDLVELAIAIEEEFDIPEINDAQVDKLVTAGDVHKYIERRVKQ
jgi:acyl carrier protein